MEAEKAKLIAAAERHLQHGSLRRAIGAYRKLVRLDPQDLRAQLKLGDLCARSGDLASSVPIFRAVAQHYAAQGQFLKATAVYKRLVELEPSNPEIVLKLAESYQAQGLRNDAADQYRTAIALHAKAGDSANMLQTVKRLLGLDPNNVAGRLRLAESFSRGGWIDEAAEQYRAACQVLRRQGRREDFARCAERLLYHDPDDIEIAKELAAYYVEQDFPQRALPKLHRCYRLRPRDVDVLELLITVFDQLNQSHKVVIILKALAAIYEQSGLQREYREVMSRVLEFDPDDADARTVFQQTTTPQVSKEIVFEAGEQGAQGTPRPEAEDDEHGFDDNGFAELEDRPPAPGAGAGIPPLPPQELSLTGMSIEDITATAAADILRSIPLIEPEFDEREELPFELSVPVSQDAARAERQVASTAANTDAEIVTSSVLVANQDSFEMLPPPATEAGEGSEGLIDDHWVDDDDRTLVDHRLSAEESTLVDQHVRLAALHDAVANFEIVQPPRSAAGKSPPPPAEEPSELPGGASEQPEVGAEAADAAHAPASEPAALAEWPDISSELEEVDFFVDQGLLDDAIAILGALESAHPGHPEVTERSAKVLQRVDENVGDKSLEER